MDAKEKKKQQKRHQSTFSQYYLNDNTKDLMSIDALTDIAGRDLNTSIGPNDLRQSFVGKANTIDTGSLVSRLQNYTADGGPGGHKNLSLMHGGATTLLHKIVSMLRKHDMDVQLLNGIRYECMRQDKMRN